MSFYVEFTTKILCKKNIKIPSNTQIVISHIFHIIETLLHKNLYNKLEYKNSYIHHVFQIILLCIRFNKISL